MKAKCKLCADTNWVDWNQQGWGTLYDHFRSQHDSNILGNLTFASTYATPPQKKSDTDSPQ